MTPTDPSSGLYYVATWLVSNGTALGVVYKWLTRPLEEKIAAINRELEKLDKRLEKIDGYVNPRASMVEHTPTIGEVIRRLEEIETWRRDLDEFRGQVVTDEEFRSYTNLAASKTESILKSLGWIKGRLGGKEVSDD